MSLLVFSYKNDNLRTDNQSTRTSLHLFSTAFRFHEPSPPFLLTVHVRHLALESILRRPPVAAPGPSQCWPGAPAPRKVRCNNRICHRSAADLIVRDLSVCVACRVPRLQKDMHGDTGLLHYGRQASVPIIHPQRVSATITMPESIPHNEAHFFMQMVEAPNSCQFVAVHINLPEMSYLLQLLSIMDDRKRSRGGAKRFERVQEKLRNATMRHRSLTK